MRAFVHDRPVNFRLNSRWFAMAEKLADEQGMSLSELMRGAVRDALAAGHGGLPSASRPSVDLRQ